MSMNLFRSIFGVVFLAVTATAAAAEPPRVVSSSEARTADASKIAAALGISTVEADKRLTLQDATKDIGKSLRVQYRDRLAGIYREWTPSPRLVVRLKGVQAERSRFYTIKGQSFEVTFVPGAEYTVDELRAALKANRPALVRAFPTLQATRTDPKTGEVVIDVLAADAASTAAGRASAILGVPVRVEIGEAPKLLAISGSGSLDIGGEQGECTGGFVVANSDSTVPGIVTAGHCPNNSTVSYLTVNGNQLQMTLVGEVWNGTTDLQWYRPTSEDDYPQFEATFYASESELRTVGGSYYLDNTNIGDALCFFGYISGASCGVVDSLDYNPNLPDNGCGGSACEAAFVSVAASGNFRCASGDSGAPVFRDEFAYGILSGGAFSTSTGACTRIFYTPLDRLDSLGIYVQVPF